MYTTLECVFRIYSSIYIYIWEKLVRLSLIVFQLHILLRPTEQGIKPAVPSFFTFQSTTEFGLKTPALGFSQYTSPLKSHPQVLELFPKLPGQQCICQCQPLKHPVFPRHPARGTAWSPFGDKQHQEKGLDPRPCQTTEFFILILRSQTLATGCSTGR